MKIKRISCLFMFLIGFFFVCQIKPIQAKDSLIHLNSSHSPYSIVLEGLNTFYRYTGAAIQPQFKVVNTHGNILDSSKYQVSYKNNKKVGKGRIIVKGIPQKGVKGEIYEDFQIRRTHLNDCDIKMHRTYDYTGQPVQPQIKISYHGHVFKKDTDYRLSFINNKELGIATVNIEGIGGLTGEMKRLFLIVIKCPQLQATTGYQYAYLRWHTIPNADGYTLYKESKEGGFQEVIRIPQDSKTQSFITYRDNNVQLGKSYHYRIQAYQKDETHIFSSEISPQFQVKIRLAKPKLKQALLVSRKTVSVSWNNVKGAQYYHIYRSLTKNGKYQKIATSTTNYYYDNKIQDGKRYYYKVQAVYKDKNMTITSPLSHSQYENIQNNLKLFWLFPHGKPTTEEEMQKYLTNVTVKVINKRGKTSKLTLRVHKYLKKDIQNIFNEMVKAKFPVNPSETAAYNWRIMRTSQSLSHHSYGCVVDLNWNDNPLVENYEEGTGNYQPQKNPYSINQKVVKIWKKYGFYWGGDWTTHKDYMHFTFTNH